MQILKVILFAVMISTGIIGASGQTTTATTEAKNKLELKTLNENGYSIQYPENWELNKSGQMGTSFILFSKLSSAQDQFKENVNLIIQDLSGQNINLAKYVEISEGQIKTMMTNGNLLESKKLNSNGMDFQRVIFTGKQGLFNLKFEQYYWIRNQKAFVLTLTCEINEFDNYKETGEKILNSFKLN